MRICVGAWVQCILPYIVFDDANFLPLYDKVCEWNGVGDVLVFVPRRRTKAPVDEAGIDPNGILII